MCVEMGAAANSSNVDEIIELKRNRGDGRTQGFKLVLPVMVAPDPED